MGAKTMGRSEVRPRRSVRCRCRSENAMSFECLARQTLFKGFPDARKVDLPSARAIKGASPMSFVWLFRRCARLEIGRRGRQTHQLLRRDKKARTPGSARF